MLQGMDTGPAIEAPVPRMNVKGIESTRNMEVKGHGGPTRKGVQP